MKIRSVMWILLAVWMSVGARAAEPGGSIRLQSGEMDLVSFLETVSERLDIQIDASRLNGSELGKVTVPDGGLLTRERAEAVVLTALALRGYTWVHDPVVDLYRITRQRDARYEEIPFITDRTKLPDSDLLVTYIMPLEHAPPDYVARTVRSFMPSFSMMIPDEATRSVFITDSGRNIAKLMKLVRQVDTPDAVKEAEDYLAARAKKLEAPCPPLFPALGAEPRIEQPWVLIGLFAMVATVIGFLLRGYVIRRIEGGL